VGHSLGNIVARKYLSGAEGKAGHLPDERITRVVMLAPPNHGSRIAASLKDNSLFRFLDGQAGQELGLQWNDFEDELAMPDIEFGIIAGGRGGRFGRGDETREDGKSTPKSGYNPWLPDDNDGTVTVSSTRLAGARDFVVLPVLHSFIMNDKTVLEYTLRFLHYGHFISAQKRCPIEAVETGPTR
jgi:hypothetical protein